MKKQVEIRSPIWNGGRPHIGVADFRLNFGGVIQVKITYRRKDGSLSYPGVYEMSVDKLKSYPTQVVKGGVRLYVAPLADWEHKEEQPKTAKVPIYDIESDYVKEHYPELYSIITEKAGNDLVKKHEGEGYKKFIQVGMKLKEKNRGESEDRQSRPTLL